ncbi:MAG: hypothetical protein HZB20_02735 [Chloroflexi bacterium]|nr:hypothetical protein [Chloroflexota bacterium]
MSQWRSWLLAHRAEMAAVGLVTLVGAGLRFYQLGAVPRVINGDEGLVGHLLVYLLIAFVLHRSFILAAGRAIAAFWLGTLLVGLPQFVYSWLHPGEFLARLNADGMFQSGWLAQQAADTGRPAVEILAGRVAHAFLSLIYYPATEFYGISAPVLGVITATLFVLGVGLALWRTRDNRYLLLNGYFWAMTMAVGVFAVPPEADSYRMLAALPAVMLLAAIGWEQVIMLWSLTDAARAPARLLAGGVLLAGVALLNVQTYFVDFAGQCRYGNDIQTRFASYLGNYLKSVDRESTVYLLSDDVLLYGTHSSVDFLSRNVPVQNFPDAIQNLTPATQSIIIAIPAREAELRAWVNQHPGGTLRREYDCGKLMLMAYRSP